MFAVSGHGVQELDDRSLTVSEHRSSATGRLHLPLWLRFKGLVDLPEVAFGIGKVCRAQSPGLVGWGSEKRDSLGHQRLVGSHPPLSAKQKDLDSWYHHCMSAYQTDSRIDEYIQTLPVWQQDICRQVRDLVHAADPEVTETIKRTKQPYFTLNGNICALL